MVGLTYPHLTCIFCSPFGLSQMKYWLALQHSVRFQPFFESSTHFVTFSLLVVLSSKLMDEKLLKELPSIHWYLPN